MYKLLQGKGRWGITTVMVRCKYYCMQGPFHFFIHTPMDRILCRGGRGAQFISEGLAMSACLIFLIFLRGRKEKLGYV